MDLRRAEFVRDNRGEAGENNAPELVRARIQRLPRDSVITG